MIFLGTIKRIVAIWLRKNNYDVKIVPNPNTYTGVTEFKLPPRTSGFGVFLGESEVQTVTNKTIDATLNTVSGISNSSIAANAAIDASKIGDGSVSSTEFGYLNGVSSAIQTQLGTKENVSNRGIANGYASLDSSGKLPISQLPTSAMEYKGTWNVATNTPVLADGTGDTGDIYIVSTGGTINLGSGNITFAVGDWAVYNGSTWQKSLNSNAVASVNGYTGTVTLTTSDLAEGTNLYFTSARAKDAAVSGNITDSDQGKAPTLQLLKSYAAPLSNLSKATWSGTNSLTVNHNQGTKDVEWTIFDLISGERIVVDDVTWGANNNSFTLTLPTGVVAGSWRVLVWTR